MHGDDAGGDGVDDHYGDDYDDVDDEDDHGDDGDVDDDDDR